MNKSNLNAGTHNLPIAPIGLIHTPFKQATGTPIQGVAGKCAEGIVELQAEYVEGLRDLAEFERVWLIYFLDRASDAQIVVQPYMDVAVRGIFATRSPARPNYIGISVVRLLSIEKNRLLVADVDMLDGTPLLDIKPYVPAFDSFAPSREGWYANKSAAEVVADDRFEAGNAKT
jgi:tRNA-Thr(GGU) m(6)t(6)A37 methyltransferase TsaA